MAAMANTAQDPSGASSAHIRPVYRRKMFSSVLTRQPSHDYDDDSSQETTGVSPRPRPTGGKRSVSGILVKDQIIRIVVA